MRALDAQLDFNLPHDLACEIAYRNTDLARYVRALGPARVQYDLLNEKFRDQRDGLPMSLDDLKRAAEET